jgi:hypothetical protein
MAQLNFYVPDDIEAKIRQVAKLRDQSISAYLAELVKDCIDKGKEWPAGFFEKTLGGWQGDFPEIEDMPPQEREWPE